MAQMVADNAGRSNHHLTVADQPAPLRLTVEWTNGTPQLKVSGGAGKQCSVDYAISLSAPVDWRSLGTNTLAETPTLLVDDQATGASARFYRARLLP